MSKFFEDVGEIFSYPVKTVYNLVTNNPKGNSLSDIYNNTVTSGNPFQQFVSDIPGVNLLKKATGADLAAPFSGPSWQDWGKPGQAFSSLVDQGNKALPSVFQPFAQPAEALALSLFNPYAGAAFQTAYQGGKQQEANKGFDWGELGKNAAINFGTAGVADFANKAISGANAARAASGPFSVSGAGKAATGSLDSILGDVGTSAATPGFAANTATALAANSGNAFNAIGAIPAATSALSGFNPGLVGHSQSLVSNANALQGSGTGSAAYDPLAYKNTVADSLYNTAVKSTTPLANNALTATLAPQGSSPVSGTFDGFSSEASPVNAGVGSGTQWGDILNAFGGDEINNPNPNGPRIDATAFNSMVDRLGANNFLQQNQARDVALPAGQYQPELNTPYANRLSEINKGSTQSYSDLVDQVNNANRYYGLIDTTPGLTPETLDAYLNDPTAISKVNNANQYYSMINSNPGLTADQIDAYIANPSSGLIGNFTVNPDQASQFAGLTHPEYPNSNFAAGNIYPVPPNADVLQGIRPLGPSNMSLFK